MLNERRDIKYQIEHGYKLQTLMHKVNKETLENQHRKQIKNKARGIDGITAYANGDYEHGSDRQIGTTPFNSSYDNNAYVGYMYGTTTPTGSTDEEKYNQTHANINNSTIKGNGANETDPTTVDGWYKANIVANNLESYVADNLFCNDRSFASNNTGTGYGQSETYYRWQDFVNAAKSTTFKCIQKNDAFTVTDKIYGNGALTYPIALVTTDEVLANGGFNSYIATGSWYWTMSPYIYTGRSARIDSIHPSGTVGNHSRSDETILGVRPVLSLKAGVEFKSGGDGTMEHPFVVKTS